MAPYFPWSVLVCSLFFREASLTYQDSPFNKHALPRPMDGTNQLPYYAPSNLGPAHPHKESSSPPTHVKKTSVGEKAVCTRLNNLPYDTGFSSPTFDETVSYARLSTKTSSEASDVGSSFQTTRSAAENGGIHDYDGDHGDDSDGDHGDANQDDDAKNDDSEPTAENVVLTRKKKHIELKAQKSVFLDDGKADHSDGGDKNGILIMKMQTQRQSSTESVYSRIPQRQSSSTESVYSRIPQTTPANKINLQTVTAWTLHTSSKGPDNQCDIYVCDCSPKNKRVACCGRSFQLQHIPRVPSYTTRFRLWMASIPSLTREKLGNLSNFHIEEMDLRNNRITHLDNDTFADFRSLSKLDLGGNLISADILGDAFHSISKHNFLFLMLDDMPLGENLSPSFLSAFRNHTLQTLSLQNTSLTVFAASVFSGLTIRRLFLGGNQIRSFDLNAQVWVQALKLEGNALTTLPVLCKKGGGSVFPNLFSLYLANNPLRKIPVGSLRGACLPKLSKLDVSGTSMAVLEDNFLADLPSLEKLMMMKMPQLTKYSPYCFNSSSLINLSITDNRIAWVRGTMDTRNIFAHSPHLHTLDLSGTGIGLPDDQFQTLLQSLQSVQFLRLAKCKLGSLPADTLWRLSRLTDLDLYGNHINAFTLSAALRNVTGIQKLNVQGNNINTVNESTLPQEFLRAVRTLDLSLNPFDCTCDILWFQSWANAQTKSGNITITSYPREYYCNTPDGLKHTRLFDYNPSYRDCHPINIYIVAGSVGGTVLFLIGFTLSLVYRFRWYLRYYIYRIRRRRQYKRLSDDEQDPFAYDIYLGYSEHDLDWVVSELLPLLEVEAKKTVYLKNRDINGGTDADNIVNYMDRSESVLLVLSNHYTDEKWSGFEFQNVLFACEEQFKEVLVVLKGEVGPSRMSKDMCRMLTKGTFLQWEDTAEARNTFRQGLMVAVGFGSNSVNNEGRVQDDEETSAMMPALPT